MHRLEVPVFSPASARQVAALGAHRIELNAAGSYGEGGLTPSLAELSELLSSTAAAENPRVPIRVMIRPRGPPPAPSADFIYTPEELHAGMRDAIAAFKESNLLDPEQGDGFVFGILKHAAAGEGRVAVDVDRNRELVRLARPFVCVFHRAFDDIVGSVDSSQEAQLEQALDHVVSCGFDGILTSGGPGNAPDNVETLRRVVRLASARNIEIIAGGGVRARNAQTIMQQALVPDGPRDRGDGVVRWLHSSCLASGVRGGGDREIDRSEVTSLLQVLGSD